MTMATAINNSDQGCPSLKYISPLNFRAGLPNQPSKCMWKAGINSEQSPHTRKEWVKKMKIFPNIIETVGNTPLVKLNKIPKSCGLKCEILVKCEFFNPGGSVKDRIGFRMIEDAEKAGILKPGFTVIEPTSGNTGIGLALGCAVKGYRCIIVMSEKMSNEKVNVLKALGAEIYRTPITAESGAPDGLFGVCHRLKNEIPNSIILDQYSNPGNPLAHYDTTAEEILDQCDGKLDMIVGGTGTGGTITGVGRKIKEKSPNTVIVGVDPEGSILAVPHTLNDHDVDFYEVEGIGYDFLPTGMDRNIVDVWIKMNDKKAFPMARRLIREEGLLCGGSSGSAMAAAIEAAKDLPAGKRVVVILPDSIRNYLTKFIMDPWMEQRGFKDCPDTGNHWWWNLPVTTLDIKPIVSATSSMSCKEVFDLMQTHGIHQIPVVDEHLSVKSMINLQKLLSVAIDGKADEAVEKFASTVFPHVSKDSHLGLVSRIFQQDSHVLVLDTQIINGIEVDKVLGVVTPADVLKRITNM